MFYLKYLPYWQLDPDFPFGQWHVYPAPGPPNSAAHVELDPIQGLLMQSDGPEKEQIDAWAMQYLLSKNNATIQYKTNI